MTLPNVPHDKEAEEAVIGSILINPSSLGEAMGYIHSPDDFYIQRLRYIWEAILRIAEANESLDFMTVCKELADYRHLDEVGGQAYITGLLGHTPSSMHLSTYAKRVHQYAIRRKMLVAANNIAQSVYRYDREPEDIISEMLANTQKVAGEYTGAIKARVIDAPTATKRAIEAYLRAVAGKSDCPTGLLNLDKILTVQHSELITIAGRPGQGKSSLLGGIALHNARLDKRVKIFQLEAGATQLTQRMISQLSGLSAHQIMRGKLTEDDKAIYYKWADYYAQLPILICDTPGITASQIRVESRRDPIDLIVLDYVQLARSDKRADRRDLEIGEVVREMKELAMELDVPIFIGAQMSRAVEMRTEKHPIMSDLRESGEIENTSDSVVFIYRPDGDAQTELIVAKHRQGPTGSVPSYFMCETMRFVDAITHTLDLRRIGEEGYDYTNT